MSTTEKDIVDTVVKELKYDSNAASADNGDLVDSAAITTLEYRPPRVFPKRMTLWERIKFEARKAWRAIDNATPRLVWKGERIEASISFSGDGWTAVRQSPKELVPSYNNGKKARKGKGVKVDVPAEVVSPSQYYSVAVDHDSRYDGMGPYIVIDGKEWRLDNTLYGRTRVYFQGRRK